MPDLLAIQLGLELEYLMVPWKNACRPHCGGCLNGYTPTMLVDTRTMTLRRCAADGQVDEATEFQPEVRGEVGAFAWHYVAHLPASEEASMHYNNTEGARHKFFQVCT